MDFEMIEDLSNEDVMNLYSEIVDKSGLDNLHIAYCSCGGSNDSTIVFGSALYGGCSVLEVNSINSNNNCKTWCRNNDFSLRGYSNDCFCSRYSQQGGTYGRIYSCFVSRGSY